MHICRFYVVRIKGYVWILPEFMDADKIKALPVQSKRYITKVMFLCAVAKPIYDETGVCLFDGKVGCWRVADWLKRKQNYNGKRVQYKKGDDYIQDCSMGARKYEEMMVDCLLPAVKRIREEIWGPGPIVIQHDGAPGHRADGIERALTKAFAALDCIFVRQPPKSPCSNMLDMAVFHSMSALVAQVDYETKEELVAAVDNAWATLKPETLSMEWACKAITFAQFVHLEGLEFRGAHVGLRKAKFKGGWTAVWALVAKVRVGGWDFALKCPK